MFDKDIEIFESRSMADDADTDVKTLMNSSGRRNSNTRDLNISEKFIVELIDEYRIECFQFFRFQAKVDKIQSHGTKHANAGVAFLQQRG